MTERADIIHLLTDLLNHDGLILAVLSAPFKPEIASSKVTIRPLVVKGRACFQVTEQKQEQALHRNLLKEECLEWFERHLGCFKQSLLYTTSADYQLLTGKKGHFTLLKKKPSKSPVSSGHNRQKDYLLQEGEPVPFLIHLGVMDQNGKVHASKRDKFRQINRFLEMIDDILPHLDGSKEVRIVDFGCGKAYLTFALYHYLGIMKGLRVQITGIDLKRDVIQLCRGLAESLGYQNNLHFIYGSIDDYETMEKVDVMVSLHACDTATDAALEKAVGWNAQVILCVPCCQHELMPQVHNEDLSPLLKHGILKERFAALATDAARAQLLEVVGYQTQILEFIDLEHTPKNLLIRAINKSKRTDTKQAWERYLAFKDALAIDPSLERRLTEILRIAISQKNK